MSVTPSRTGSFAYLLIIAGLSAIGAAILYISLNPFMKAWLAADVHTSTTSEGQEALSWHSELWGAIMVFVLIAIVFMLWLRSRRESGP